MLLTEREQMIADIDAWTDMYGRDRSALLSILQQVQKKYGRIFSFSMQKIADALSIHPVEVYGVVSFYSFLNHKPHGHFMIRMCQTISCDMAGKDRVARQLENDLGIEFGQTTADGLFSLKWTNCMGMCDQGPALMVNHQVFTNLTPEMVHEIIIGCKKTFAAHTTLNKECLA